MQPPANATVIATIGTGSYREIGPAIIPRHAPMRISPSLTCMFRFMAIAVCWLWSSPLSRHPTPPRMKKPRRNGDLGGLLSAGHHVVEVPQPGRAPCRPSRAFSPALPSAMMDGMRFTLSGLLVLVAAIAVPLSQWPPSSVVFEWESASHHTLYAANPMFWAAVGCSIAILAVYQMRGMRKSSPLRWLALAVAVVIVLPTLAFFAGRARSLVDVERSPPDWVIEQQRAGVRP